MPVAPPSSSFAVRTADLRRRVEDGSRPGEYEVPAEHRPEGAEREAIRNRLRDLKGALRAAEPVEIGEAVTGFLSGFTSLRGYSVEDAQATAAEFCKKLAAYPAWAIRQACDGWDPRAAGGDPRFPPTPAQLQDTVRAVLRPWQHEAGDLEAILRAKAPEPVALTAEQRAELDQRLAEITGRAKPRIPAGEDPRAVAGPAEHSLERLKALGMGGLQLSDAALASAGIRQPQDA